MTDKRNPRMRPPLPKEHGSWAMFLVPFVVGLVVAQVWQWRSILLILAALGFFLLRFPLDMLVKTRNRPNADHMELIRWAAIYGAFALICGGWLIFAYRLYGLVVFGAIGAALLLYHFWLVDRRKEMSAVGELTGIFGLALGAPMAYYTASGQFNGTAAALWLVNALYFGGTVFYIKLKVRQQPRLPAPDHVSERLISAKACLTYQSVVLTIIIVLVALQRLPALIFLAFVPMTLKVLYGALRWQERKTLSLPRLGAIEVVHSILFAALVIIAL